MFECVFDHFVGLAPKGLITELLLLLNPWFLEKKQMGTLKLVNSNVDFELWN